MPRMIVSFDHPSTTTVAMTTASFEARRPGEAAAGVMECSKSIAGSYADRVVYTETVLGRDGRYWRGYRRSRGPAGTEVWVRR